MLLAVCVSAIPVGVPEERPVMPMEQLKAIDEAAAGGVGAEKDLETASSYYHPYYTTRVVVYPSYGYGHYYGGYGGYGYRSYYYRPNYHYYW